MAKDPAVLFYTSDFLSGTSFFTYEQRGQYITLLCQQHQLGEIPENHMISICGSLDSIVVKKFVKDNRSFYHNIRMRLEGERRRNYCDSRSNNKSGRPPKKKGKIIRKSYDNHKNIHMENENENINDNINAKETKDIITDLNLVLGTVYKHTSKKTVECITARLNEKFNFEDFKVVHRKMLRLWGTEEKMIRYLRPETLYSNKFEGYLNMKEPSTKLTETGMKAYLVGQSWLKKKQEEEGAEQK